VVEISYSCAGRDTDVRFTKKGNSIDYAKAEKEVMLAV
jgi:hypothetical protein